MPTDHLANNFSEIIKAVNEFRPKRGGKFVTRVYCTSPPSKEIFQIDPADFPIEDFARPEDEVKAPPQKRSKFKRELPQFARAWKLFQTPA